MWLLEFLFFAMTLVIGWTLFGYLLYLWFAGLFRAKKMLRVPASNFPRLSIIVPCYNEAEQILAKLDDLRRLTYPRDRLEIIFADGDSTDDTVARLTAATQPDEAIQVVRCPRRGKVHQLNHVLPMVRGEIVVNTDVDARLAPDALAWIAATFDIAPEIWVVGAYCRPASGMEIEQYYWDS
ncbi:MAG: glycosyltransferase, partial [Chloroflexota bacterium]